MSVLWALTLLVLDVQRSGVDTVFQSVDAVCSVADEWVRRVVSDVTVVPDEVKAALFVWSDAVGSGRRGLASTIDATFGLAIQFVERAGADGSAPRHDTGTDTVA